MKYIINEKETKLINVSSLSVSKFIFLLFNIYITWYKEIWGDKPYVLYGSVIALTLSIFIPLGKENGKKLDFNCMTGFFKVLLVFGLYCLFSGIIVCKDRTLFISSMVTYFCFLIVLFDCCVISQRDGNWIWLFKILFITALICGVYIIFWGKPKINGGVTVITLSRDNNPNSLAFVMIAGIYALIISKNKILKKQILQNLCVLMLLYIIVLSGSRKALISACIILLIWIVSNLIILKKQHNNKSNGITFICICLFIVAVIWFYKTHFMDSSMSVRVMRLLGGQEDTSNENRIELYKYAIDVWKQHPIFGIGFNQFRVYFWDNTYSHSIYAEVLSCTGTIGTIIFFLPIFYIILQMVRCARNTFSDDKYMNIMYIAGMIAELFLGVGLIWIYGVSHELFLLSLTGSFEYQFNKKEHTCDKEAIRHCKYMI